MKITAILFCIISLLFSITACTNQAGPAMNEGFVGIWQGPAMYSSVDYQVMDMSDTTFTVYFKYSSWDQILPAYKGFLKPEEGSSNVYVVTTHAWAPRDSYMTESSSLIITNGEEGDWITSEDDAKDCGGQFSNYFIRDTYDFTVSGGMLTMGGVNDYVRITSVY